LQNANSVIAVTLYANSRYALSSHRRFRPPQRHCVTAAAHTIP